ncbi:uncharacterized protein [Diadema setosum]|uniref:uncharacterized protein isoform X1 n=2 Tax=Diadema setosum TaxID=31175 RepID=UPI003B3A1156
MTKHIRIHSPGVGRITLPSLPPKPTTRPVPGVCAQRAVVFVAASIASPFSLSVLPDFTRKQCAEEGSKSGSALHMEYFVLVVLAPLTVVCLCCVIMFYYHRRSGGRFASHSSSLPTSSYSITSDPHVPASQSPLISSHRFSAQHQQERLRKQREMVCPQRSESTEKFPTSVCLLDEDEPQHMRENVRIHREVMSENGIRAPPNRTVYDSEQQDLMRVCSNHKPDSQRHSVRRSPSTASSKRGGGIGGGGGSKQGATTLQRGSSGGEVIDSETRSPLNLVDSDMEGPPPYASLVQTNNNSINVCDDSTVSTSSSTDGLLQVQQDQQQAPFSPCQPNSNGRYHANTRGASRGSGVRLKYDSADCV